MNGSLRYCIGNAPSGSKITFAPSVRGLIKLTGGDLDVVGDKQLTIVGPGADQLTISGGNINAHFHVSKGARLDISGVSFKNSETVTNAFLYNEGTLTLTNSVISDNKTTANVTNLVVLSLGDGGGISNRGTLVVNNSIISGNTVTMGYDGGIANSGTLTLNNSTVSHNTATRGSGGIGNSGMLTLNNSIVSHNTASGDNGGTSDGGGIGNEGIIISNNSIISDNTAYRYNGGISSLGTLTLNNSIVSRNTAGIGNGGIWSGAGAMLTLTNSTVSGNTAQYTGGIYSSGTLTLINSTVSGTAAQYTGGIGSNGSLRLTNSTVSDNTASKFGGGIFIQSFLDASGRASIAQADLTFSTIYGNTAPGGGDIAIQDLDSNGKPIKQLSRVRISNSIVTGDAAYPGPDIVGMLTSSGYNLFQDTSGASFDPATRTEHDSDKTVSVKDLKIDPLLRDNGGPRAPHTRTHALLAGSPAIDAIPLQYCQVKGILNSQSGMYTDQRGRKRPDGTEQFCDIGAYEYAD